MKELPLNPRMVTVITVFFNRPKKLTRMLDSIQEQLPGVDIVVANVSEGGLFVERSGVKVVKHEWLEGKLNPNIANLSAGRNLALSHVETPYFLLMDEDHWVEDDSSAKDMMWALDNSDADIVGGNYKEGKNVHRFFGHIRWERPSCRLYEPEVVDATEVMECDFVQNFFMGRTSKVREMGGWDEQIPIVAEHMDFFLNAKMAGLKVAHIDCCSVQHDPGPDTDADPKEARYYKTHRRRLLYRDYFYKKWKIEEMLLPTGLRYFFSEGKLKYRTVDPKKSVGVMVMTIGRSGSSCLSGCLNTMGVNMGNALAAPVGIDKTYNPYGYFEDLSISVAEEHEPETLRETLREHMAKMSLRNSRWGMKAPWLTEHVGLIREVAEELGIDLRFVMITRPMEKCINSLLRTGWTGDYAQCSEVLTGKKKIMREAYASIPDEKKRHIQFEDLTEEPLKVVRDLAHWIEVTEGKAIVRAAESVDGEAPNF